MARDETAREHDREESLLDRRGYLKLAGAAAATIAGVSTTATAASSDYETITVGAGETFTKSLASGETWENKLVDITATDAAYKIEARKDNWTIRNVGIKGQYPDLNDGGNTPFIVHVDSPDATGLIENIYLGDGGAGETFHNDPNSSKAVGLFIDNSHAGHLDIRNLHVANWPNNGVYGSSPGNPDSDSYPGAGGSVTIDTSYADNNDVAGFRIGTTGSSFKNCVASNNRKGFWAYYEEIDAVNCDAYNNNKSSFTINDGTTLNLTDCRAAGSPDWGHLNNMGTVNGTLESGTVRSSPPQGVPPTPKEAALGESKSNDGGSSTDRSNGTVLELVSASNASSVSYEFTVDGSVQKRTSAGDMSADYNDIVTDNNDGTVTVAGKSGNGYGDSYTVDGTIRSMTLDESKWTICWDGQEVSVRDITSPVVDRLDVSKSNQLGNNVMFSVKWAVSDAANDLDVVEVVVNDNGDADVNFSVTDVSGGSASDWDMFQFPTGRELDISVRATDAADNVGKTTKTVTL